VSGPAWPVVEQFSFGHSGYTPPFALDAGQAWMTGDCNGDLQSATVEVSQAPAPGNAIDQRGQEITSGEITPDRGPGAYFAVPDTETYVAVVSLLGAATCRVEIRQQD
jgi:hypothetical protein